MKREISAEKCEKFYSSDLWLKPSIEIWKRANYRKMFEMSNKMIEMPNVGLAK